ncbi:unnamed protein product [Euphydryas editha]|uniref:FLYWCH-type domain-containing protein n=1 Tax=Euphydryas editha TaxID=104508 RepID=A0AAU9TJZ8_EUPED|nr:unnamed protein product [Euphydryas editha]
MVSGGISLQGKTVLVILDEVTVTAASYVERVIRLHVIPFSQKIDVLEFVPSNRGKGITLIYKGYTYAHIHSKTRWYCSKKAKGCKARLHTTDEGELVAVGESSHNHPPPTLFRDSDGKVHRL